MSQVTDQSSGSAPTSPHFAETLQRAYMYAEEQAHRLVTAEHMLLALTEDPDCVGVLRRKTIDIDHLRNEVAGLVSRNFDRFAHGDGGQPIYGADLLRVLNTAGAAASVRRPIDGALALAALIADGRTPASELIKLYGLTFDDAARAPRPQSQPQPQPQAASAGLPPLASLRTAARESALGMRKRPTLPGADDLAEEPLNLPLPPAPLRQPQAPDNGARRTTSLRASPPPNQYYPEPEPQAINGHAPAQQPARDDRDYNGWNGEASGRMNGANGAYAPTAPAYAPPAATPAEPDYNYPDEAPEWQAAPPQAAYDYAGPTAPPPARRQPAAEEPAPPPGNSGKTRGRKAGKSRRKAGQGILAENIPRSMQAGVPVAVEARIARHEIEAAMADLARAGEQGGAYPAIVHAMSVRLRSPDGAVRIEGNSPETQWIDGAPGLIDDEFANWRWTLTPTAAGGARMQLISSIRRADEGGLSAEFALPEQTVEVRVSANTGRLARKALAWAALIAAAVILGAFAESLFHFGHRLLGR